MTTRLSDIFDLDAFTMAIDEGYIRVQHHPTESLAIANYAEKAQFDRFWTPETLNSRGLIYNPQTEEVIARGFPKFFNWDDSGQPYPPTGPMVLSTKFDGSLGILYYDSQTGWPKIATRGSFSSDQALHASSKLYWEIYSDIEDGWITDAPYLREAFDDLRSRGFTPLFEIIYPSNRIVVDYHGADRLVLLDVVDNATGKSDLTEFDNLPWPDKAEKRLIPGGFSDSLTHEIPQGEEGFVLYWPGSGFRCKMKSAEYVELHRIVTGLSKRSIWQMLGEGKSPEDIKAQIPDELFAFVDETVIELYDAAGAVLDQAFEDFDFVEDYVQSNLTDNPSDSVRRALFAREAQKFPETRPYLFRILDGSDTEDIWKMAWKTIRPAGDSRAWNKTEDIA